MFCHLRIRVELTAPTWLTPLDAGVSGTDLPLELETDANLAFVFDVNVFGILKVLPCPRVRHSVRLTGD